MDSAQEVAEEESRREVSREALLSASPFFIAALVGLLIIFAHAGGVMDTEAVKISSVGLMVGTVVGWEVAKSDE